MTPKAELGSSTAPRPGSGQWWGRAVDGTAPFGRPLEARQPIFPIHAGISDVIIGDQVTIGHGSIIHCNRIGNNVLVGMNSTLNIFSEIGDLSITGAQSLVGENFKIPPGSLVIGVPARITRKVNKKEIERITSAAHFYVDLSRDFKRHGL